MKRRANGEGTVRKRADGRWEARLERDGRRKSVFGMTQGAVLEKLRAVQRSHDSGAPIANERDTVGSYLASWLESSRPQLRLRTWTRYEQFVRLHTGSIARIPIAKLGPQHLERLYADRLRAGAAPMSVRHLHALLHKALKQAASWGLIARNVADLASPPRAPRHEIVTLTEAQTRTFLAAVRGDRFEAVYVLAATAGLRQGELLGLRWSDVDLDRASVQIRQTVQFLRGEAVFSEPKTERSRRKVEITKLAIVALRAHRRRQLEERLVAGSAWDDRDLVCTDEVGGPMRADRLRWAYWSLMRRAGLPPIRFHDLRHGAATIALANGIHPKIVSEMLGHSSVAFTMDVYQHVTPTMQREATAVFDAVLGGKA